MWTIPVVITKTKRRSIVIGNHKWVLVIFSTIQSLRLFCSFSSNLTNSSTLRRETSIVQLMKIILECFIINISDHNSDQSSSGGPMLIGDHYVVQMLVTSRSAFKWEKYLSKQCTKRIQENVNFFVVTWSQPFKSLKRTQDLFWSQIHNHLPMGATVGLACASWCWVALRFACTGVGDKLKSPQALFLQDAFCFTGESCKIQIGELDMAYGLLYLIHK